MPAQFTRRFLFSVAPLLCAAVLLPVLHAAPPAPAGPKNVSLRTRLTSTTALTVASSTDGTTSAVTLVATVDGAAGLAPGGSVVFTVQGKRMGEVPVANGAASLTLTTLPAGLNALCASYQGDSKFLPSQSATIRFYNDEQD